MLLLRKPESHAIEGRRLQKGSDAVDERVNSLKDVTVIVCETARCDYYADRLVPQPCSSC